MIVTALFGSSDGLDGDSGAAGIMIDSRRFGRDLEQKIDAALSRSDSFSLTPDLGEAIMLGPTGNNLRDLYLLARG
jgi:hydroxypyruvate reductase